MTPHHVDGGTAPTLDSRVVNQKVGDTRQFDPVDIAVGEATDDDAREGDVMRWRLKRAGVVNADAVQRGALEHEVLKRHELCI